MTNHTARSQNAENATGKCIQLSIVVPVYNEEENLRNLQARLRNSLSAIGLDYEIIYVDDGSRDSSFRILAEMAERDNRIKVVRFRRNYGQTAAMSAGMDAASGRVIIPLDADLQNDPADIPALLAKMEEGYDVVSGWRRDRKDSLTKTLPSAIANRLISRVTGVRLHDYGCSLKAYRGDLIKEVRLYGEMHRFIPAFAFIEGAAVTEIPVAHHPRVAGKSKYGLSRTFKVFLDLITVKFFIDYARKPIHFFGFAAAITFVCGLGVMGLAFADAIFRMGYLQLVQGLVFALIFFFMALMFVMMGLLAELGIRTHHEAQGKRIYTVSRTINL